MSTNKSSGRTSSVSFIEFWILVSDELSQARLHLNKEAKSLEDFISTQSDVRIYLHEALRASYKKSSCQHLRSPISIEAVLDTLGETAFQLQSKNAGDLFDIELLEEIAWMICDRFPDQVTQLMAQTKVWNSVEKSPKIDRCRIISFPDYKIRKANANL